jgi:hypothetical protein
MAVASVGDVALIHASLANTARWFIGRRVSTSAVAVATAVVVVAACSAAPAASTTPSTRHVVSRIIPAPSDLIGGAIPPPNGSMWVLAGNGRAKTLTEIDLSNGHKIATVPVSTAADAIAQSPTGLLAVGTATATAGSVQLRNGSSGTISSTVTVGAPVRSLAFGADGVTLYVLNGTTTNASITVVDTTNGQTITTVGCPKDAVDLQPDPAQSNVWTVQSGDNVQETSLQTGRAGGIIKLNAPGIALTFSSSGAQLYVLRGTGSVWNIAELSAGATSIRHTIPAAAHSVDLVASPDGPELYDLVGTGRIGNIQVIKVPSGA